MFDPSYLLSERVRSAESEAHQLRLRLAAVEAERDSILQDLQQVRSAKLASDRSLSELSERCSTLERDVAFYEERAAQAISTRDRDIEAVRVAAFHTESQLRELTASLEQSQAANKELRQTLEQLQTELSSLRLQHTVTQEAAQKRSQLEIKQLRNKVHNLEDDAARLKAQLAEAQAKSEQNEKLLTQAHKIEDQMNTQVKALKAELAAVKRQLLGGVQSPHASPGGNQQPRSTTASPDTTPVRSAGASSPCLSPPQSLPPPRPSSTAYSELPSPRSTGGGAAPGVVPDGGGSGDALVAAAHTAAGAVSPRALSWAAVTAAVTVTAAEAAAPETPRASGHEGLLQEPHQEPQRAAEGTPGERREREEVVGERHDAGAAAVPPPTAPSPTETAEQCGGDEPAAASPRASGDVATVAACTAVGEDEPGDMAEEGYVSTLDREREKEDEREETDREEEGAEAATAEKADENGEGKEERQPEDLGGRLSELQEQLRRVEEELQREKAAREEEREQLEVLRVMVHDFKIKLAQATQEKVEALMKAAQLTAEAQQQQLATAQQQQAHGSAVGLSIQRQHSTSQRDPREHLSRRPSKELSRSPSGSTAGLLPAVSAPSPASQPSPAPRTLWSTWWHGATAASGLAAAPAAPAATTPVTTAATAPAALLTSAAAAAAANSGSTGSNFEASMTSEEGVGEADSSNGAAPAAAASAAAEAAAAAATVEAAEGRNRRLAVQLERLRGQLAAIDRLAGHVGRCQAQLRSCAGLLWSSREEDAPRKWAALGDLTRLAEECGVMRAEAGLPPQPPHAASATSSAAAPLHGAGGAGVRPHHVALRGAGGAGGESDDISVVCTRESGGVQRRVAEVLLGSLEFGVKSIEQYSHHSAMSSVMYS